MIFVSDSYIYFALDCLSSSDNRGCSLLVFYGLLLSFNVLNAFNGKRICAKIETEKKRFSKNSGFRFKLHTR